MKKVINGKMYNTETAMEMGYRCEAPADRLSRIDETLYRKHRTGEYFLHGCGGPMTSYCRRIDDQDWSGSSQIIPMTEDEARKWAEKYMSADEYAKAFGEPDEGDASGQIAEIVRKSGLTQKAFAEKYHIPSRTVESWCMGERQPPEYVAYLLQLAEDK